MVLWTAADIFQIVRGESEGSWQADGVSIDTRTLNPGDVFVAIGGEKFDGHDYVAQALEKGAVAAIVSHIPDGMDMNSSLVLVPDVMKVLEAMARYRRERIRSGIIGVTGSVGKTTVKEMLRFVLSDQDKTSATEGNLNNHIGLPLSLVRMEEDCRYGVFEMGMNHAGEIKDLTGLVRPDVAIITAIEAVHLEFFANESEIAAAKSEIFLSMDARGVAVIPGDSPYYSLLMQEAQRQGVGRIVRFGLRDEYEAQLISVQPYAGGQKIRAKIAGLELQYVLPVLGEHHALNSVIALAAVEAIGADVEKASKIMEQWCPPSGRGESSVLPIPFSGQKSGSYTLIDDAYNASPASMRAALEVLAIRKELGKGARSIAVLGDMLELGEKSSFLHANLSEYIMRQKIDRVYCAGNLMKHLAHQLPPSVLAEYVGEAEDLLPLLQADIQVGDYVLIKGSHGSNMWKLVKDLKQSSVTV